MDDTITEASDAAGERGIDDLVFMTAATGELSRSWEGLAAEAAEAPGGVRRRPSGRLPFRPAVPIAGERSAVVERLPAPAQSRRAPARVGRLTRRGLVVVALFLAVLASLLTLAVVAFVAAPPAPAPSPSPTPQAARTALSREAHPRLFAASSVANQSGQDSPKAQPEAVP